MQEWLRLVPTDISNKITLIDTVFGNKGNTIDNVFRDIDIGLINMDVEGAEKTILEGCRETIKNKMPVLAICAYHRPEDLIEIPKLIQHCSDEYCFYLRKYKGYSPSAVNEYLYYAVPKHRMTLAQNI